MHIGILGINYKSAEIGMREWIAKACQKRLCFESEITKKFHCVVLSTCNRTEIYFSSDSLAEAHSALLNELRDEIQVPFEHKLYSYFGFDCFLHLAQVTSGLDSVIIAESEIQRQVKIAYEQTSLHQSLPGCMHYLFQKCLKLGKEVRTLFSFSAHQMSIAKIVFEMAQFILGDLVEQNVLFIGNSEVNRKGISFFKKKGVEKIALSTRSLISAEEMGIKENLTLIPWENRQIWQKYSLVICGSKASYYLIDQVEEPVQTRLIFDLGVPRNVNPKLSRHPCLNLLNMEELSRFMEKKQEKNFIEINQAQSLILQAVQRYQVAFKEKQRWVPLCV